MEHEPDWTSNVVGDQVDSTDTSGGLDAGGTHGPVIPPGPGGGDPRDIYAAMGHHTDGPAKLPPSGGVCEAPLRVGEKFGTATITGHQVISRPGNPLGSMPAPELVYDRYIVTLGNGKPLAVDIPRTPKGGMPWGVTFDPHDAGRDKIVSQARSIMEGIGSADPRIYAGTSSVEATTNGMVKTASNSDPIKAAGWQEPDGRMGITNEGMNNKYATVKEIMDHEGGHGIGQRLAPGRGYTDGFADALAADGGKTSPYASKHVGQEHLKEAYAEAHRLYQQDPIGFGKDHPAQAQIIERDLAEVEKLLEKEGPMKPPAARPGPPDAAPAPPESAPKPPASAKPPVVEPPVAGKAVAGVMGRVVRKAVTAVLSTPVAVAETVVDVMSPTPAGPTGWHRNDRQDWNELVALGRDRVAKTPGLTLQQAVIDIAQEKGDPLADYIVRDLRRMEQEEKEAAEAREDQKRTREFYQRNYGPPKAPRKPPTY